MFNRIFKCSLFREHRYQFSAAICANLIALAHGAGIGWLSPTLLILRSADTPLETGMISIDESSWIGSLLCVGGFTGNLLFGYIANKWGRKKALCLLTFPQISFWLIIIFSRSLYRLYLGRILAGISGGGSFVTVPLFVSDIARKQIRGSLGSFLMLGVNTGILIGFVIGSYLSYTLVPKVEEAARKSLCFYQNIDLENTTKEKQLEVDLYMEEMKSVMGDSPSKKDTFKDFVSPAGRKSILIGIGLVAVNIFSGIFCLVNYTAMILQQSGTELAPNEAAIIVSVSQIGGTYLSTLIVDHIKRRTLLMITTIGTGPEIHNNGNINIFSIILRN